ncbi:PIG-X-domain-containing protein [Lindgomyces ingoldianus]|uniref:PIG-X-domain-containing protein n=1 Tax=Lindgomyces ingoldianus TaxID=673940 RepID=A0ACB6R5Q7_9PLEO|nr:PIG-X-domain-containing protein [Lindgomyces ingoldianus]KAF2474115.1 PIG-X-domain-containing protein [Lindgomyces ingoldianus]
MKQRITYLVRNPDEFTPEQLAVKPSSIALRKVNAAKEHRITLGLEELPDELRKAFNQWHELHIRWASESPYDAIPPFTSRVSPGLHVFYTPQKDHPDSLLCPLLKEVFGNGFVCEDPKETFIKLPILSERFSMSSSTQFYTRIPDLASLVSYFQSKICPLSPNSCKISASTLLSASYVDIDYDAISHTLIINAFWARAPNEENHWTETISLPGSQETIEIGILNNEPNPDPEDISFSGFLTVLGQDTQPKPTRFQTPTRHYPLSASSLVYKTSFAHPTGLHPTLILTLPTKHLEPPDTTCRLHAHLTLPRTLFIDKYQFSDSLFLSSHHITSLRSISGATDLEAPDWVVPQWGSAALFELDTPSSDPDPDQEAGRDWNITIPLHLRYFPPSNSTHTPLAVPWPVLFWACRAEEGTKMSVNPFDRIHLGYEALFGPKTRFMHIPPAASRNGNGNGRGRREGGGELVEWIDVPVLDLRKAGWVEVGTVGVVLVSFLGLCWVLFGKGVGEGGAGVKKVGKGKKRQ